MEGLGLSTSTSTLYPSSIPPVLCHAPPLLLLLLGTSRISLTSYISVHYSLEALGRRWSEGEHGGEARASVDLDALTLQRLAHAREHIAAPEDVLVDEQRLHGVAGGRVVTLGVTDCWGGGEGGC